MLDEQDADAAPFADAADFIGEPVDLFVVEAGGGFVEQDAAWARIASARASSTRFRAPKGSSPTGR